MGCFIVPAAEAVITTVATKMVKSNEKEESVKVSFADGTLEEATKIKFSTKLGWLNKMLWGGSVDGSRAVLFYLTGNSYGTSC